MGTYFVDDRFLGELLPNQQGRGDRQQRIDQAGSPHSVFQRKRGPLQALSLLCLGMSSYKQRFGAYGPRRTNTRANLHAIRQSACRTFASGGVLSEPGYLSDAEVPLRRRVFLLIGWLLILGSAVLIVMRIVWAAEPYQPLGGELSRHIVTSMIVVGAGLCGFAVSRGYRWVGGLLAIVLTWGLWVTMVMTTLTLFAQLKLDPDVWGWWVTFSDMLYEGAVARSVILAVAALLASLAALRIVRAGTRILERLRARAG